MCSSSSASDGERIFLSIGSNLGERQRNVWKALELLKRGRIKLLASSALYETEPVDSGPQPDFINLACEVSTRMSPRALMEACLAIEGKMGREKTLNKGPRLIDIDILLFGKRIINETGLQIPHPRLANRRFVLVPLNEIAPIFPEPVSGRAISDLLSECRDESAVRKLNTFSDLERLVKQKGNLR